VAAGASRRRCPLDLALAHQGRGARLEPDIADTLHDRMTIALTEKVGDVGVNVTSTQATATPG
jgi:hypothetical protein